MSAARSKRLIAAAGCLVLLAGISGYFVWPRQRFNLLLITLDTTRADRVGCYGYQPALTPTLDQLAGRGVLFENAFTACPLTLPSHSTMFTGLSPREHGIHYNGVGKLDAEIPTLAEMCRSRGYETGAFVGAFVLNRKFGLDRGFQMYDDATGAEIEGSQVSRRRGGQIVVDAALAWLKNRRRRQFFCWVHLFDPHAPYKLREELFGEQFAGRLYDAGIAFADRQIGRLIAHLERQGLTENTLIVVVGDHGEGLREHSEYEHGLMLYNSTLRVPLIAAHPALCKAGYRVRESFSLVDLLPMLRECLGFETARTPDRRSLKAALQGRAFASRPCYAETDVPRIEHRWAPQRSVLTGGWKYIRSPRPELYDLSQDPGELHNLAGNLPAKLKEMETLLKDTEARLVPRGAADAVLSQAERRALATLGYVGTPAGNKQREESGGQSLPDVKDRIPYHEALLSANRLLDENRPGEALVELRRIVADVPDFLPARLFLGEALAKSGRLEDALEVFRQLAHDDPRHGEVHARLGWVLGQQGNRDEALAELRRARELAPETAEYRINLGASFSELGSQEEARQMFQSAIEIDPAAGNFEMARLFAATGNSSAALKHYLLTLQSDPNWIPLYSEVSLLLARQKRFDEAVAYALRAVDFSPKDANLHYNLGVMKMQQGKFAEAIGPLEEALRLNAGHQKAAGQLARAKEAMHRRPGGPDLPAITR
jgi:arylsulfatase A-like enzyme/Flp pilus assembly protein TadD